MKRYEVITQANLDIYTCTECGVGPIMLPNKHDEFHDRLAQVSANAERGDTAYWSDIYGTYDH